MLRLRSERDNTVTAVTLSVFEGCDDKSRRQWNVRNAIPCIVVEEGSSFDQVKVGRQPELFTGVVILRLTDGDELSVDQHGEASFDSSVSIRLSNWAMSSLCLS
ncbi:hypothetical protein EMIT0P100_60280 [Pseudomonas sp. IT-P100]